MNARVSPVYLVCVYIALDKRYFSPLVERMGYHGNGRKGTPCLGGTICVCVWRRYGNGEII